MELILMRHGTTQGNTENRFIGSSDVPLIPQGEELAREVGKTLPTVEHIYRSPMLRCEQTADLLWPEVVHTVIDQLRETDFGPFEGKNHEELKDDPLYLQWMAAAKSGDFSGLDFGEDTLSVMKRSVEGLAQVVADMKAQGYHRCGLVSHGGTLMSLLSQVGRPKQGFYQWMCGNCSGYQMDICEESDGSITLQLIQKVGGAV